MYAVKAPLSKAQHIREELQEKGFIDFSRRPKKEVDHLLIPVTQEVEGYEIIEAELEENQSQTTDLRTALEEKIPAKDLEQIKTAFDIVGDIAILEIDPELREYETIVGETLLEIVPAIKVVVRKDGAHEGELRIQDYKHLAGENRFETVSVENGVRLTLDIRKSYYSVRSATERKRICELVKEGEDVLVMFAGIGPFTVTIAKNTQAHSVVGVELNEDGHRYAQINIEKNAVKATTYQGDVREVVPTLGTFDRILMPLPHTAQDFLDTAVPACKEGGMIHLYHFSSEEEVHAFAKTLPERLKQLGREGNVEHIQKCGNLAPGIHRWSIDIRL